MIVIACDGSDKRNSIRFCAHLGKSAMETVTMNRQASREENVSCTQKAQTHETGKG
jgi:hypothetical protein